MGRWRPPAPKSSAYITEDGFRALEDEQKALWLKRREVVKALAAAAAEGDRSENAEYIYRKKELGGIDRRIRYLQKRLPDLTIVREFANGDAVFFGATVTVSDEQGQVTSYRIVGPDEANAKDSSISMDSPIARALLSRRVGDEVVIQIAGNRNTFAIEAVQYD